MKQILRLPRIRVEYANAISGLVYGFPAMTHFLGFIHSIERDANQNGFEVSLKGCAVVCHDYQLHGSSDNSFGDTTFNLSKHPLTEKGDTAPVKVEEGKIHLTISLLVDCDLNSDKHKEFANWIQHRAMAKRLAGGRISTIGKVECIAIPHSFDERSGRERKILRSLLPGFILMDRQNLIEKGVQKERGSSLDAMLNYYTLRWKFFEKDEKAFWDRVPRAAKGWLVPIQAGYRTISELSKGEEGARDKNVPFGLVEPLYGLAEWKGLHLIKDLEKCMWRYLHDKDVYLTIQK